ncbi:MAG: aspartate kinase [Spirochaetales bacterium]|nr:aspartate kinase [Spirochaetales bacterium]
MKIMKFGGSSIANSTLIEKVARIVAGESEKTGICLVLSAMKGVTDLLIGCAREAENGKTCYKETFNEIKKKHLDTVETLFTQNKKKEIREAVIWMLSELEEILHGIELVRECSARSLDVVMSFGEKLSCRIMASYLPVLGHEAVFIDASDGVIITDNVHGSAAVLFTQSYKAILKRIKSVKGIPVVTGFIASTSSGVVTTLGRNGSDYTASIVGAGLDADIIEIWTDVDGVLSADPRYVKEAFVIPELSYQEAMELSYFGAKVIHPYTMIPAIEKKKNILIKNTLNPETKGTLIADTVKRHSTCITGIACIDRIAIINVEGCGMVGIPGIAARILGEIAAAHINIIMISQASSEHSICLALKENEAVKAHDLLNRALADELATKQIQNIDLLRDLVIIAVIGENMRGTPGISGRLFSALGLKKINVYAIAQGSSERNISFVTGSGDKEQALLTLHHAFLEVSPENTSG